MKSVRFIFILDRILCQVLESIYSYYRTTSIG
nr:MAG TPA: hypothetical protein [Caudoviricetes sp.]